MLKNHESNIKHPEIRDFVPSSQPLLFSQESQPLSDIIYGDEDIRSYDLSKLSSDGLSKAKNGVAVLIMTTWNKTDLKQMKTAITSEFLIDSLNYTRLKTLALNKIQHLTDDRSSFYITGEKAREDANISLTVIRITQLLLDAKFKFNQFTKPNQLDIKNWNPALFQKFFMSNGLKLIMESVDEYAKRKGTKDGFSLYYRNRNWISKSPKAKAGHIYAAYFKFLGELYLYIGININPDPDKDFLANCHIFNSEKDSTALGTFIRDQMKVYLKY